MVLPFLLFINLEYAGLIAVQGVGQRNAVSVQLCGTVDAFYAAVRAVQADLGL